MARGLVVVLLLAAGCVDSSSRFCGDGKVCPDKTLCDATHGQCVATDAFDVCKGVADGSRCTDKLRDGICDQGVCIPGCGDGIQDTDAVAVTEECDDGNNDDHDGCAAVCRVEKPTWIPWDNLWTARSGHTAAWDFDRKKLVVFGGNIESGPTDDLWERDITSAWEKLDIPRPTARTEAMMAYDKARHVMVLFGGAVAMGVLDGDTWEYDTASAQWTLKSTTGPSPRSAATMIYDEKDQAILLFGGYEGLGTTHPGGLLNDLWKWDGTKWTQLATTGTTPPGRRQHGMTWDATRNVAVMFGGIRLGAGATGANFETWELSYTGSAWTWTCTSGQGVAIDGCPLLAQHPSARSSMQLAYSTNIGQVVLFGGLVFAANANTVGSDTWTYNGAWTAQTGPVSPEARSDATLTDVQIQDEDTGITASTLALVAGGTDTGPIDNVWEFNSAIGWLHRLTPGTAAERSSAALLYDRDHDRTLRIAGLLPPNAKGDAFAFDGTVWRKVKGLPSETLNPLAPSLRFLHSAAYDATRSRVLVFGGLNNASQAKDDLFILSGQDWSKMTGTRPSARWGAAFAHDEKAGVTVLFGGQAGATPFADTWELDATTWTAISDAGGPPAQAAAAMAYDRAHEQLVMFDITGSTWTYANHKWTKLDTVGAPSARVAARLVYNASRKRITLYGGNNMSNGTTLILGDLWELSEAGGVWTWAQVLTSTSPPVRGTLGFAAHDSLGMLVLHGGSSSSGQSLNDTWLFQYRYEQ